MPRKDWKIYIEDILEAIGDIQSFTAGIDWETFRTDKRTINAVLHSFTIIGEAARKIPPEVENRHADIPWAEMRGLRDQVVREARNVDLEIVWDIIENYLPPLVLQLRPLLQET